ncbi:hypothetical protein LTR56_001889 [Elasticomyces elasticus]|nr:hypothetical protein LTR56_001889 [Elasticomyces elasticus]KAK3668760.1 hypothetical protein LTR22_000240 [Elasticomyces elasticus]KAK4930600.1 hypothetical protein LTR49_003014 [Elasticomyces elasticus]KAK5757919.1 hypothetical protein LTS12_011958 [Elasticomyces elasticus]
MPTLQRAAPVLLRQVSKRQHTGSPEATPAEEARHVKRTKRFRSSFSDTVTILAGKDEAPFIVHQDTISQKSDFLTAACKHDWINEAKTVPVPEIEPCTFKLYAHWAYTDGIDLDILDDDEEHKDSQPGFRKSTSEVDTERAEHSQDSCDQSKKDREYKDIKHLIDLHIAADYLGDPVLKDRIIDKLTGCIKHQRLPYLGGEILPFVWGATAPGSGLRKLLLDYVLALHKGFKYLEVWRDTIPAEFFYDLTQECLWVHGERPMMLPTYPRRKFYYDPRPAKP